MSHWSIFLSMLLLLLIPTTQAKLHAPPLLTNDLDSPTLRQSNPPCADNCRFRFCNFDGTSDSFVIPKSPLVLLNEFNTVSLPFICLPSEPNIGFITSFGEAQVNIPRNGLRNISQWNPDGLSVPFPSNFVRPLGILGFSWSGITTSRPRGNQWRLLNRRCMALPIKSYSVTSRATGRVVDRVNLPGNDPDDCVAFRTVAPLLQIQARWDSRDDFDLEVMEPDGTIIDWVTPRSNSGRLNGDNNVGLCASDLPRGRENVRYNLNSAIPTGTYTVRLNHFSQCSTRSSNWEVSVVIGGIRVRRFSGSSNNSTGIAPAFGRTVLDQTFDYP
eukprot:GFKZ01015076.1.p1 GENE.GFKZ01015076.1~~GFKZ01015076.1.p1  ORF type:complete len:329 (+),score=15.40 GFKZ01015076.1:302-1288(+)